MAAQVSALVARSRHPTHGRDGPLGAISAGAWPSIQARRHPAAVTPRKRHDMERRHRHLRVAAVAWLLILGGLAACSIPPPPARQPFRATDHFQGKALELAQAVDRKDATVIRHLIRDEGVNPDTIFDQANMPMVAWPIINQNFDGLRLLLDNGANPNARKMMPLRERGKAGEDNAMVFAAG